MSLSKEDYSDRTLYEKRLAEKRNELFEYIDRNSLMISSDARTKLLNLSFEMLNSGARLESRNGRWNRLNYNYYMALIYFYDGEIGTEDEEIILDKLIQDVVGSVEAEFCVEILDAYDNTVNFCMGYGKDASQADVQECLEKYGKEGYQARLVPSPEKPHEYISAEDIYRYEYMKTILAIFKEDFPNIFIATKED